MLWNDLAMDTDQQQKDDIPLGRAESVEERMARMEREMVDLRRSVKIAWDLMGEGQALSFVEEITAARRGRGR